MASTIAIVLKAVDQYSSTLTGLNAGFGLVGKTIGALKDVASSVFGAIASGVDLAKIGGAFDEQRNQFEFLAKSYELNGQNIIDTVKRTSGNTITEFDSIKTATKAVAAGFRGPELNDALLYIKRWSEATGESFTAVSEKVFTSMSSGRYAVLRQMGLVIENGAKLSDVTKAMTAGLQKFGDTGFNAADKLDSMTASQDDFFRKLGQSINQSEIFQSVLGGLADTIVWLVEKFDPRPITAFFDVFTGLAGSVAESAIALIPGVESVYEFINGILNATTNDVKSTIKNVVSIIFGGIRDISGIFNGFFDALNQFGVIQLVQQVTIGVIEILRGGAILAVEIIGGTFKLVSDGFGEIFGLVSDFAREYPALFDKIGISAEGMSRIEGSFKSVSNGIYQMTEGIISGTDAAATIGQKFAFNLGEALKKGIDLTAIDNAETDLNNRIDKIDFSKKWDKALKPTIAIPELKLESDIADKAVDKFSDKMKNEMRNNLVPDIKYNIGAAGRDLDEFINKDMAKEFAEGLRVSTTESGAVLTEAMRKMLGIGEFAGMRERQMEADKARQEEERKRLDELERALTLEQRIKQEGLKKEFDLRERERQLISERVKRDDPLIRLQDLFRQANWPAEMDAFMRVIFSWLIRIAGSEQVPLAITMGV